MTKKINFNQNLLGFSLIELLISFGVISAVIIMGLFSFGLLTNTSSNIRVALLNETYFGDVFDDFYDFYLNSNYIFSNCTITNDSFSGGCIAFSNFTNIPYDPKRQIKLTRLPGSSVQAQFGNISSYQNNAVINLQMNSSGKIYNKYIYHNITSY
jgi:type II secretory pathway pseudopilin PulG